MRPWLKINCTPSIATSTAALTSTADVHRARSDVWIGPVTVPSVEIGGANARNGRNPAHSGQSVYLRQRQLFLR